MDVEITEHLARVAIDLRKRGDWATAIEVAATSGVAGRTTRHHLTRLVKVGVVELVEAFPGHRYRWSTAPSEKCEAFVVKLDAVIGALGLEAEERR